MYKERPLNIYPPLVNWGGIFPYLDALAALEREGIALGAFVTRAIGPPSFKTSLMPPQGADEWIEELKRSHLLKPLIASIIGTTPQDYAETARKVSPFCAALEVDLGPSADSPAEAGEIVGAVREVTDKPVIVKLFPATDYISVARSAQEAGAGGITCAGNLGTGLAIDIWQRRAIAVEAGGGLISSSVKPVTLAMVYKLYEATPITILAYGDVSRWEDVVEYMLAGASIVGLGAIFTGRTAPEAASLPGQIWSGVLAYLNGRDYHEIIGEAHGGRPPTGPGP